MSLATGVALLAAGRFRLAAGMVPARAEIEAALTAGKRHRMHYKDYSFASINLRLSVDIKKWNERAVLL